MSKPWYEEFGAIYRDETETLKNGFAAFIFEQQLPLEITGGRVVVTGVLQYGAQKKIHVRVLFPHAYPDVPPEIVIYRPARTQMMGNMQMQTPEQPLFLRPQNQYRSPDPLTDGKLCLFEDEKVWTPFHDGVSTALHQAINWLEAVTAPSGVQPDQAVQESLPMIANYKGQMVYYLPADLPQNATGRALLKRFEKNNYALLELHGEDEKGKTLHCCFPDDTALSLPSEEIVIGKLFYVEGEESQIMPQLQDTNQFKNFLLQGLRISFEDLLPAPATEAKTTVLLFRFKGSSLLHAFEVQYWKQGVTRFQHAYLLPKNLSTEIFTRVEGLLDLDQSAKKKIVAVGMGAIGSEVMTALAGCGFENFVLIDHETFDAGNTIRHAADLLSIGVKKVIAVKRKMEARNPKIKAEAIPASLFDIALPEIERIFKDADIVLDLTANRLVEGYIDRKAFRQFRKPVLQASCSRGGLSAAILLMVPGQSACLNCLKGKGYDRVPESLQDLSQLTDTVPDYGVCSRPAMPASGIDTKEAALQAARVIVQFLSDGHQKIYPVLPGYQFYLHGPAGAVSVVTGEKMKPFDREITAMKGEESCENCKPHR